MALSTVNITTATTTLLGNIVKKRDLTTWQATLFASGAFGGTTINWLWSPDGGNTKLPITSAPGTAVTSTAADSFNILLGTGSHKSQRATLYAQTSGGTGININVGYMDNN